MKSIIFAKRNLKELLRDPVSLIFLIGLPLFLLVIFQQFQIPSDVYNINNFAPSIVVFSFSFISLFSGLLISKDRITSFLTRLFASPLKPSDYIKGYSLALIPVALVQSIIFLLISLLFGLNFNINLIITIIVLVPVSLLFIAIGLLLGCAFNDKQSPAASSLVVQLMCFTSGMWFDIDTVSKVLQVISNILPFRYALDIARYSLSGSFDLVLKPAIILLGYIIVLYVIAIIIFKRKMTSDTK